jgi:light-regulated signal transduction histidine kinase (bacteriophytochrome)
LETDRGLLVSAAVRDVTAQKVVERDLMMAKEAAEAASRELEAFSYSVAHDLRAPLRSIDGFSHALREEHSAALNDEAKGYLKRVSDSAQHMAQLIDGLLNLARINRSDLKSERVDLSALARRTVTALQSSQPERRVEVVITGGLAADGDARLLGAVIDNLLQNAWKFTAHKADARIEFGADKGHAGQVYFVRDNGAGFSMDHAGQLFKPFQRLHRADEFEGTGIGLATVQRVVQRHGGRIWAQGAPGSGATFYFTLGNVEASP